MAKMDEYEFIRSQLCAAPLSFRRVTLFATDTHEGTRAPSDAALDCLSVTDRCTHARTHARTQTTEIHMYMSSKQTLV